jgi:hypothetical protein
MWYIMYHDKRFGPYDNEREANRANQLYFRSAGVVFDTDEQAPRPASDHFDVV